ncbi:hypothetical protein L596_023727 [Steinernema carpocapsae]|uniref:Uncharacterized protein n=1 Tax=Steinernema carpocapsae TaxID=34508 RepID=A0A4U5MEK4_STECR|nr:hypothetical protein L596_023727 [Steinernema carpocapsae]
MPQHPPSPHTVAAAARTRGHLRQKRCHTPQPHPSPHVKTQPGGHDFSRRSLRRLRTPPPHNSWPYLLVVKAVMKKRTFHYSDFHTIEQMKADWSIVEETQWNTIVNEVRSKIPANSITQYEGEK